MTGFRATTGSPAVLGIFSCAAQTDSNNTKVMTPSCKARAAATGFLLLELSHVSTVQSDRPGRTV
jgi:hypothetical protein